LIIKTKSALTRSSTSICCGMANILWNHEM